MTDEGALLEFVQYCLFHPFESLTGPSCSKLTTSLVNVSLKFQTFVIEFVIFLILQIHCHFLLKKCENPLHCKGFSHFFNKNNLQCMCYFS